MMISYSGPVVTRAEAKAAGEMFYFTGAPCPRGHVTSRRVSTAQCTTCVREAVREYKKANREVLKMQQRTYYKVKGNEPGKAWVRRNREKQSYKDSNNVRSKRYALNNQDKVRAGRNLRRARELSAPGVPHTAQDLVDIRRMQGDRCAEPSCRCKLRGKGHPDHIIPLSRGGANDRRNIQWLCVPCNLRKHAKDPLAFARELGRLL